MSEKPKPTVDINFNLDDEPVAAKQHFCQTTSLEVLLYIISLDEEAIIWTTYGRQITLIEAHKLLGG